MNTALISLIASLFLLLFNLDGEELFHEPAVTITPTPVMVEGRERVSVVEVVDGDTIKVDISGNKVTVRLIGVDTPETKHPSRPVECFGKEASLYTTSNLLGNVVELEQDVGNTDRYGRLLRYVWLDGMLFNELMVREGYAHAASFPPDVKYQERLRLAQEEAQRQSLGLWSTQCKSM